MMSEFPPFQSLVRHSSISMLNSYSVFALLINSILEIKQFMQVKQPEIVPQTFPFTHTSIVSGEMDFKMNKMLPE